MEQVDSMFDQCSKIHHQLENSKNKIAALEEKVLQILADKQKLNFNENGKKIIN